MPAVIDRTLASSQPDRDSRGVAEPKNVRACIVVETVASVGTKSSLASDLLRARIA